MACNSIQSSSSSSQMIRKYDVILSFRGSDTRNNFTDHLLAALHRKGIATFTDDSVLHKGESIAPEFEKAIEDSKVSIVVFSKNYASSSWCLQELSKILDYARLSPKLVMPIFYDVDPSEVRKQSGHFGKAFAKHAERFKDDSVKVQRWRAALTQAANISGWDVRNKPQYTEIEKIVEEIINKLSHKGSSLPDNLVGMQSPLEQLEKLLLLSSVDDVRVVGIWGIAGVGKTTLATVLYDKISHQYDACCFIDDVGKTSGAMGVQKLLLGQTLKDENLQICDPYDTTNLKRSRLRNVKVLIVLDEVDQVEQLEKLALNRECFGAGSRIIVISRDKQILKEYGVDIVYEVPLLNADNALQLFCRKAFEWDDIVTDYKQLAHDAVKYANGLPLAIKVLGSFLFDRDVLEWRRALARLRESPRKDIMDLLRLSFDGLEKMEKEIFLDIACFFNRYEEQYVKKVLNCCEFDPDVGIRVLIEKSLISIRYDSDLLDSRIEMHDLLQELGREIVQETSTKQARKWSRLWLHKDFYNVMCENMEENVEAIVLTSCGLKETEMLMVEPLSKMSHLRLLILHGVKFSGSFDCLSNELRYVEWHEYPFMYLPSSFKPNQLVELILEHSNIKQLWKGKKYLPSLRTLDLSHSKNLIKMPDLGELPNLERLNLEGCPKLVQVDPSIGHLRKLIFLNLKDCKSLVSIPNNILDLNSLEYFNLSNCSKVCNNPMNSEHLKRLDTSETMLGSQSMSSFFKWIKLPFHFLYPRAHNDSGSAGCLLPSLPSFSCLRELDISFCSLSQIPDAIGCIRCLERLNLGGNNFVTLPCSIKELSRLVYLNLQHCKQLKSLPDLPSPTHLPLRRQLVQDHVFTHSRYWRLQRAGLYIFNCPKLGERDRCSSMTFSWMIQVIRVNQESFAPFDEIDIVIPGSEISRWFNNQSVGSSISIDPSPIMHDDNCIGVVCSAVFVAHDDPTTLRNERKPSIRIGFQCKGYSISTDIHVLLNRDLVTIKSDHMWLFYFTRKVCFYVMDQIKHQTHDLDGIKLATLTEEGQGLHLEVKNCGYRLVFKEDLRQLSSKMMRSGDPLDRKRKFLVIEDMSQP